MTRINQSHLFLNSLSSYQMGRVTLEICPVHNTKSFIYCKTCKRVVCSRCEECVEHEAIGFKTLLREYRDNLTPGHVEKYERDVSKLLDYTETKIEKYKAELEENEVKFKNAGGIIARPEERKEREFALMKKVIEYLQDVQMEAFTNVLKERAQRAIESLNIEDKISEEIEEYRQYLNRLDEESKGIKRKLEMLGEKKRMLERVGSTDGEEKKLALVFCLEKRILL